MTEPRGSRSELLVPSIMPVLYVRCADAVRTAASCGGADLPGPDIIDTAAAKSFDQLFTFITTSLFHMSPSIFPDTDMMYPLYTYTL